MKRGHIAIAAIGVVLIAVVVAGVLVIRSAVTDMAVRQAEAMGFRDVTLVIDHLGPTSLHIASLTLGPGRALGARDITIRYSPFRILSGRLDEARVGDVLVAVSLRSGEPMLPFMEHYKRTPGDIVLPVDRIDIEKSSLNIVSSAGDYEFAFSGAIKGVPAGGLTANGTFKLTGGAAQTEGKIAGKMDGSGAFEGTAEATSVMLASDVFTVASGQAEISARGSLDGLGSADAQFALVNSRLGGITLETLDGDASYRPGATRIDLTLNSRNPHLSGTAGLRVDAGVDGGPAQVGLDAKIEAADFQGLDAALGQPAETSGSAALRLSGTIEDFAAASDDISNRIVPRAMRLRGDFTVAGGQLRLRSSDLEASASGILDIAMENGKLSIGSEQGLTVSAANWGSLLVTQQAASPRKPLAVLGPSFEPGDMSVAAALQIMSRNFGSASGRLDGTIVVDPAATTMFSAMPLTLHLAGGKPFVMNGMQISGLDVSATVQGGVGQFEGDAKAAFDLASATDQAPMRLEADGINLAAKIGRRDGADYAIMNDCATAQVKSFGMGPMSATASEITLCPAGPDAPLADLRYAPATGASLALAGAVRAGNVDVRIARDQAEPVALTLALTPIAVSANKPSGAAPLTAQISMAGANLDLPDYKARIRNAGFTVDLTSAAKGWSGRLRSLAGQLVDLRQAAVFSPFDISAEGTLADGGVKASVRLGDPTGKAVVNATASYDAATGDATAAFHTGPIAFSKSGLQPQRLFPILRGQVTSVTGGMSLDGAFDWHDGVMTSKGDLTVSNLGLETFIASIDGVDAKIAFDSLWPLSTPLGQRITVQQLNPGLVFLNGDLTFHVTPGGDYVIEQTSWPWAGGRLFAENVRIHPGEKSYVLPIEVQNVDLATLVKLLDLKDLSISSTIGGELPIVVEDDVPYIRNGRLTDDGKGGFIRYQSQAADNLFASGGPSASLATRALKDFQFKSAAITIDGALTGDLDLGFHISGFNPELYDGYPIEFNLGVQGKLGQLVRAGMASMNITRELQQRLKEGQ